MQPPPRQRTAEEERARAAARQAEKELWERTRGAGSAVFKLAEAGRIKPKSTRKQATTDDQNAAASTSSRTTTTTTTPSDRVLVKHVYGSDQIDSWSADDVLPPLDEVEGKLYEPVSVPSADVLLSRGICDYTLLPKTLGRGKFSTVFVASKHGELHAIKHTALFPHHQLIATRLLREPTLLAELPPHPNLVTVKETIRTPGHFYLVEEYLDGYVTLEALLPMLNPTPPHILPQPAAESILTQLLSAVRAIHVPLQICHRDIKPENILIHPDTLQLKLLDFGLATHFSKSEPKLSTCCGSPAFHCPEIVKALASPPGTVVYMGPEVDAWTCGVTMLRCLTGARFPLGATHSSLRGMSIRAQRAVASISDAKMREKVGALLDMDGKKRMKSFEEMVKEQEKTFGEPDRGAKHFKSTTFIPASPTHSIKLPLVESANDQEHQALPTPGLGSPSSASRRTTPSNSRAPSPTRLGALSLGNAGGSMHGTTLVALNPTHQSPERVISFIKYCLRCAGILYHTWPDLSGLQKTSRPGLFGPQASHPTTHVTAAFAEAIGSPLDAMTQPSTPLFPPSLAGPEDRADGYAHVQVFECVVEIPEEKEESALGGAMGQLGQLSLVQSIMAAFSRKPAAAPLTATSRVRQESGKAASPSPTSRGQVKRSLSTPAQSRATPSSSASPSSSKDGSIRCLTFHLIVKFPQQHAQPSIARQAVSRASSYFGPAAHAVQSSSGRSRSRASSAAGALPSDGLGLNVHHETPGQGSEKVDLQPKRSNSPSLEFRRKTVARTHDVHDVEGGHVSTTTTLAGANLSVGRQPNRSPSTSRPASRTRKRSSRGFQKRAKVYIHVSDDRAVEAIRDALSVGGTVDAHELDDSRPAANGFPFEGPASDSVSRRSRRKTRDASTMQINAWPMSTEPAQSAPNSPITATARTFQPFAEGGTQEEEIEQEDEVRGRSMSSNRTRFSSADTIVAVGNASNGGATNIRAPSQLSTVALKEESPASDDFAQSIDSLTRTMTEIVSGASAHSSSNTSPSTRSTLSSPQAETAPSTLAAPDAVQVMYNGRQAGLLAQARSLLQTIAHILHKAERRGSAALEETIAPVSFTLFAALSPALGMIPTEVLGLPASSTVTNEAHETATTLRGLAMSSFDLIARHASPREVFLAVQERIEVLGATESSKEDKVEHGDTIEPQLTVQIPFPGPSRNNHQSSQDYAEPWSSALEVAGLLHVLGISISRLKTKKPTTFLEPLVNLIPRAAHAVLRADVRLPKTTRGSSPTLVLSNLSGDDERTRAGATPSGSSESSAGTASVRGEALPQSPNQLAACEIGLGLVALCRGIARWTKEMGEEFEHDTAEMLSMLFYSALIALLPELPKPRNETYLADLYFRHFMPRYNFLRPKSTPVQHSSLPTVDALSSQLWTQMRTLIKEMQVDVERQALEHPRILASVQHQEEFTAVSATRTMGAFMLLVNLDARQDTVDGDVCVEGPNWTKAEAKEKLRSSIGLLVACLGNGPPATISKDGTQSLGGLLHLPDTALAWALWCVRRLETGEGATVALEDEEAIVFVNTLATHAALCPRPYARQISLYIVSTTLKRLTKSGTARELLRELIEESPYPQLRSASVGLARTLIAEELSDVVDAESGTFADADFVEALSLILFSIPGGAEESFVSIDQDPKTLANLEQYVDEHTAWLCECLAFVYLIVSQDAKKKQTGIRTSKMLATIKANFLLPINALLHHCRLALKASTDASTEHTELDLAVSMIEVGLDRAMNAVEDAARDTIVHSDL